MWVLVWVKIFLKIFLWRVRELFGGKKLLYHGYFMYITQHVLCKSCKSLQLYVSYDTSKKLLLKHGVFLKSFFPMKSLQTFCKIFEKYFARELFFGDSTTFYFVFIQNIFAFHTMICDIIVAFWTSFLWAWGGNGMKCNEMKWKKMTNNYLNGFRKKEEGTENDNNYESEVFFVERRIIMKIIMRTEWFFWNEMKWNGM